MQRKIDKTLKVIKSSKKFYTGDSTLDENTAYTLQNEQPDDDDYGFASHTSDLFHKKLMEKYQKLPEDKKFSSGSGRHKAMSKDEIQSTKDRVKNALAAKDDDHHFKQGSQHRTSKIRSEKDLKPSSSSSSVVPSEKKIVNKPKPKLKAAPIVDFQQLLKLAAQKQHEEITIEVPTKKEPERLLTSKEKRELEEIEAARRAKMKPNRIPKLNAIPKVGEPAKHDRNNNEGSARRPPPPSTAKAPAKPAPSPYKPEQRMPEKLKKPMKPSGSGSCSPSSSKLRDALQKQNGNSLKPSSSLANHKVPTSSKAVYIPTPKSKLPAKPIDNGYKPTSSSSSVNKNVEKYRPSTSSKEPEKPREFPPKDLMRSREFPPKDLMRSREFPPKDLMRSREFPPKDLMRSREFPPRDIKRPNPQMSRKRNRVIEDEESDYDSEMDDFIDDGDAGLDYSSEIKKIFGYDKSRSVGMEFIFAIAFTNQTFILDIETKTSTTHKWSPTTGR